MEVSNNLITAKVVDKQNVNNCLNFFNHLKPEFIPNFNILCQMLKRAIKTAPFLINKNIKLEDTGELVCPENGPTIALYKLLPYYGEKDYIITRAVKDEDGDAVLEEVKQVRHWFFWKKQINVFKREAYINHKAPFGIYKFMLLWQKWWFK